MQDIDFDELDRAVSTVIGGEPDDKNSTDTSTNNMSSDPQSQKSPTSSEPVLKPAPTVDPVTVPASRRASSGRFMDIVHPSSDMRTRSANQPNLRPMNESLKPTPEAKPQLEQEEVKAAATHDWFQPLESPFLPDAKVEKRPLGGSPDEDLLSSTSGLTFEEYMEAPDEPLLEAPDQELLEESTMPDPIDFAAAAVSQEVNLAETALEDQSEEEGTQEEPGKALPDPIEQKDDDFVSVIATPVAVPEAPIKEEPIGPTSITPQYKEQPVTEQSSGAIYDTESYHQPVAQPPKKKSSWLVIVWISLLVLLGAAAGAGIYFFVLPML